VTPAKQALEQIWEHRLNMPQWIFDRDMALVAAELDRAERQRQEARALIGGLLIGGMSAAWTWAYEQDGWWYTSDLMGALGVSPTHADNYAKELTEKGLLHRERSDPKQGGKRFRYRAVLSAQEPVAAPMQVWIARPGPDAVWVLIQEPQSAHDAQDAGWEVRQAIVQEPVVAERGTE
jgi:hypothetical protein